MASDRAVFRRYLGPLFLGIATLLGLTLCEGLARHVRRSEGNLAWDDADYLRRGLRIVNRAGEGGFLDPIRALVDLLAERPKPPMLAAWVAAFASVIPRENVVGLIEASSVVPFGLLIASVIFVSSRRSGPGSTPIAALALAASPMSLAFGAKVMVETLLGLWILLTIHHAALVLDRPTRKRSAGLGLAVGLAMLTKLTVALILPAPAIAFLILFVRRFGAGRMALRTSIAISIPILLVAGPWYARNGREAIAFARFSSRYNVAAEGRSDRTPTVDRLESMASRVVGWPAMAALGVGLAGAVRGRRRGPVFDPGNPGLDERPGTGRDFVLLAMLAAVGGATILLIPPYFDPRFLLPIWPSLAVACASGLKPGAGRWLATLAGTGLLAVGVAISISGLRREPQSTTSWAARTLIDRLVAGYGVRSIANVGDTADWNVCKTGFLNELRADPGSCFVLHDLSAEGPAGFRRRARRMDAIVVLKASGVPKELLDCAPGLNRAFDAAESALRGDLTFREVACPVAQGLPPLSIFVRHPRPEIRVSRAASDARR